jgi:hypothetical protein
MDLYKCPHKIRIYDTVNMPRGNMKERRPNEYEK